MASRESQEYQRRRTRRKSPPPHPPKAQNASNHQPNVMLKVAKVDEKVKNIFILSKICII